MTSSNQTLLDTEPKQNSYPCSTRNPTDLPLAVSLLAQDQWGNILCVSRKSNPSQNGFPGGKKDEDDPSLVAAMLRETKEEVDLELTEDELEEVYEAVCKGENQDYWSVTYRLKKRLETFASYKNKEGCWVSWIAPKDIIKNSAFAQYNKAVLDTVGIEI